MANNNTPRRPFDVETAPGTKQQPPGIFAVNEPVAGLDPWALMFASPAVVRRLHELEAAAEHYKQLWQKALKREQERQAR